MVGATAAEGVAPGAGEAAHLEVLGEDRLAPVGGEEEGEAKEARATHLGRGRRRPMANAVKKPALLWRRRARRRARRRLGLRQEQLPWPSMKRRTVSRRRLPS